MNIIFRNSRSGSSITERDWPAVPRTGETVIIGGIEHEVQDVDHALDHGEIVVHLRAETGIGRQVMEVLSAEGYI